MIWLRYNWNLANTILHLWVSKKFPERDEKITSIGKKKSRTRGYFIISDLKGKTWSVFVESIKDISYRFINCNPASMEMDGLATHEISVVIYSILVANLVVDLF